MTVPFIPLPSALQVVPFHVATCGAGVVPPFTVTNGYIDLPKGPGLGIEIDEDYVMSRPLSPKPDVGRWFHEDDGSVADW